MMKHVKSALIAAVMFGVSAPAMAATVPDQFFGDFLTYMQANYSVVGAEYDIFSSLKAQGFDIDLTAFSAAKASLLQSQLALAADISPA